MSVRTFNVSVHRSPDTKLSVWSVAYVTRRLSGFSTDWRNDLPFSSNLFKICFSVTASNFDPNEPPTKGKLIGNETSPKLGFGNSDDLIDDMAG